MITIDNVMDNNNNINFERNNCNFIIISSGKNIQLKFFF